jgi:Rod binding domain-containing protein
MSLSVPGISGGALPPIDQANQPAVIRNGDAAAKKAYQVGLSFEQVFVDQLTQELASTVSDPSSDGSSDGSSDSSGASGLMGGDAASSAYANMLPQTLTSSIMSGGGTGIALQIAKSLDPALGHPVANNDKPQGAKS